MTMLEFDNFAEMDSYLRTVDDGMRKDGVPIQARPLQALSRISLENSEMEFNISEALELPEDEILGYSGNALTRQILNWFDELYGDRLKIKYWAGKSVSIIRDDPYRMAVPIALGDVDLIFDPLRPGISGSINEDSRTIVNVLDHYDDLSVKTALSLTLSERTRLVHEFRANGWRVRGSRDLPNYEGTLEIRPDLDASVEHILSGSENFGLSRWHSLQAAEKALKSVIACQGRDFPKIHDLFRLAHETGHPTFDPILLETANCAPSVRYENSSSSLIEAVRAHQASIAICCQATLDIIDMGVPERTSRPSWASG
ncbi:HEPN domain-containing protein [Rhodopseudomonas sp. AAP120]|uniref:HEPN domain-containing protein n=1 Tax=Rhodopseudomonas sp. AAP120 TaxID=1523430 RepID=UPI000B08D953|nr:HEPN domain-containing protein [Rhodopseudomonas sp. AAP120]